ncbi:DinB family protein [Tuberibacillus sp. Marseille-P3662]|uniref:DinB family protein n=1 Tax=Tuberibacillus sp. Marseille-P3662 TaxID=1965358 RepID=UPI0020CA9CCE|nr:DinB family protein [Tuberibacillus sp. Marseille-P3662]
MKKGVTPVHSESVINVEDIRHVFKEVDLLVDEFLKTFQGQWDLSLTGPVPWQDEEESLTTLWLFTHTTTHEFHHKGQMVSMGRQLGYIPFDTDLIEPAND